MIGNMKKKANFGTMILFVFLLLPFLGIAGIKNAMGTGVYQAWQTVSLGVLFILFLVKYACVRLNWSVCLFTIYQLVILGSSTINHGISPGIIVVTVASVLIFILFQTNYYYEMIGSAGIIIILSLLINFPTVLQNREIINAEFFIGGKNALGIFLIPGIFILLINSLEKYNKASLFTVFAIVLSLITVFVGASGTGIVVALCALLFLLVAIKFKPKKIVYLGVIFAVYGLFLLLSEKFFIADYWVKFTDMLGKDGTLTGRTAIWNTAAELIRDNWLFGVGRGAALVYINARGERQIVYEAHNFVMEILLEGGAVALVLYGLLFFKAVRRLNLENPKQKMVFVGWCVLLINGLTESTVNSFLVMMLLGIACRYANEQEKVIRNRNG